MDSRFLDFFVKHVKGLERQQRLDHEVWLVLSGENPAYLIFETLMRRTRRYAASLIYNTTIVGTLLLASCQPPPPPEVEPCPVGLTRCDGVCTNLLWDWNHCGSCEESCNSLASDCIQGKCACGTTSLCGDDEVCRDGSCLRPYADGKPCEFDTECFAPEGDCCETVPCGGECVCAAGRCTPFCVPEQCDAKDNDCNGLVDEDLDAWCYSGPTGAIGQGSCRAGFRRCSNGRYTDCEGEVLPVVETGPLKCNGLDDDCDGCPDPGPDGVCHSEYREYDVVVAIDISGSMSDEIDAVRTAAAALATAFPTTQFRFALVLVAMIEPGPADYLEIRTPLTDYASFVAALTTWTGVLVGGTEPTYDAVYNVGSGDWDADLGFRDGSIRVMIVFTDEMAQSIMWRSSVEVCKAAASLSLAVVTLPVFYGDWPCAQLFPLTTDAAWMTMSLEMIFDNVCGGD